MAKKPAIARKKLEAAFEATKKMFSHRTNYTGADIGYRWTKGVASDEIVVRVHVARKIPVSELESMVVFPPEIEGVPLDVMQGDYRAGAASPGAIEHRASLPYSMGGTSCGRADGGTGSIGMLVLDKKIRRPGLLSNWHVLAGPYARSGDGIIHPGVVDGGNPVRDLIGRLDRWMLDRDGDAAFAYLATDKPWLPIQFGSFLGIRQARRSKLGETLVKSGRSTGVTKGRVDGEGSYRISYEVKPGVQEARDIDGFKLVPITAGNPGDIELSSAGDSGSVWMHAASEAAVGLHFAGETSSLPQNEHAIACNVETVLDRLDLEIAGFDDLFAHLPAQITQAMTYKLGITPQPDGPDWPLPLPGPQPWPWDGPWPTPCWPRPWPQPQPWPAPWQGGPVDTRVTNPGQWFAQSEIITSGSAGQVEKQGEIDQILKIWDVLKRALADRGLGYPGMNITDKISRLTYFAASPAATITEVVNASNEFGVMGLRRILSEFLGATTFSTICFIINQILKEDQ